MLLPYSIRRGRENISEKLRKHDKYLPCCEFRYLSDVFQFLLKGYSGTEEYHVMAIAHCSHVTSNMSAYGSNTLFSTRKVEKIKRQEVVSSFQLL